MKQPYLTRERFDRAFEDAQRITKVRRAELQKHLANVLEEERQHNAEVISNVRALIIYTYEEGRSRYRTPRTLDDYRALLFYNYGIGKEYDQEIANEYWTLVNDNIIESDESKKPYN